MAYRQWNMDISEIRYSQCSIDNTFHRGGKIGELLDDLCYGRCYISDIPTIRVAKEYGHWCSADNRRLWVMKQFARLGLVDTIPVKLMDDDILEGKLSSKDQGMSVKIRGGEPGGKSYEAMQLATRMAEKETTTTNKLKSMGNKGKKKKHTAGDEAESKDRKDQPTAKSVNASSRNSSSGATATAPVPLIKQSVQVNSSLQNSAKKRRENPKKKNFNTSGGGDNVRKDCEDVDRPRQMRLGTVSIKVNPSGATAKIPQTKQGVPVNCTLQKSAKKRRGNPEKNNNKRGGGDNVRKECEDVDRPNQMRPTVSNKDSSRGATATVPQTKQSVPVNSSLQNSAKKRRENPEKKNYNTSGGGDNVRKECEDVDRPRQMRPGTVSNKVNSSGATAKITQTKQGVPVNCTLQNSAKKRRENLEKNNNKRGRGDNVRKECEDVDRPNQMRPTVSNKHRSRGATATVPQTKQSVPVNSSLKNSAKKRKRRGNRDDSIAQSELLSKSDINMLRSNNCRQSERFEWTSSAVPDRRRSPPN